MGGEPRAWPQPRAGRNMSVTSTYGRLTSTVAVIHDKYGLGCSWMPRSKRVFRLCRILRQDVSNRDVVQMGRVLNRQIAAHEAGGRSSVSRAARVPATARLAEPLPLGAYFTQEDCVLV